MSFLSTVRGAWRAIKSLVMRMMPAPRSTYRADLFTTVPLRVDQYIDPGDTPGNVGVCLSGGGSRAMIAGMGQLRALRYLKTPDGRDLLGQARAISCVSGGAWLAVPFAYLQDSTTDDQYLNLYVADPGRLVLTPTQGHLPQEVLSQLPPGNAGQAAADRSFGAIPLALEVLFLHKFMKVPTPFLWQTAIGLHVLKPQGLFPHDRYLRPTSLFSWDQATRERQITALNPSLAAATTQLVASGTERSKRPFLVCNMAMFVQQASAGEKLLAPVHGTAFATGIYGEVDGTDAAGRSPGGGGVASFAFSSSLTQAGSPVSVSQSRPLALMDIVGTSSAFFAESLQNIFESWKRDGKKLHDDMMESRQHMAGWAMRAMPENERDDAMQLINKLTSAVGDSKVTGGIVKRELEKWVSEIQDLTPEYAYWPVKDAKPDPDNPATRFADGGNLENTGIANLLAYEDIDRLIACVNADAGMVACSLGVFDEAGQEIAGTRILLSAQVPVLFGYQPWQEGRGYRLYAGDPNPKSPVLQHNQVFPSDRFPELLKGLWTASGNTEDPASLGMKGKDTKPGLNLLPANFTQILDVLPNRWFGIKNARRVQVMWCYLNRVRRFHDALRPEVQAVLGDFDRPGSFSNFPNYSTISTHLTPTEINLMASLTADALSHPQQSAEVLRLFRADA
ncbi:MAG: hypothetical protein JNN30_06925 [Rhodanobacteraceae bacterium]|nr:hypothetical protein [Rhodanobacteraceae bacterium]